MSSWLWGCEKHSMFCFWEDAFCISFVYLPNLILSNFFVFVISEKYYDVQTYGKGIEKQIHWPKQKLQLYFECVMINIYLLKHFIKLRFSQLCSTYRKYARRFLPTSLTSKEAFNVQRRYFSLTKEFLNEI